MSRFRLYTVFSGLGGSLLCCAVLAGLSGSAAARSAVASGSSGEGNAPAVSHTEWDYPPHSLALSGRYAYVVTWEPTGRVPYCRVEVFDVSESVRRASIQVGFYTCIEVDGGFAYLAGLDFKVLDVSDPASPQVVGVCSISLSTSDIAVDQSHAYLGDMAGLSILDISDPASPTPIGNVATPGRVEAVAVTGSYAYLAAGTEGLVVVDVSDPSSPSVTATCALPGFAWDVTVRGSRAYVADGEGLEVLDISRPAEPRLVGSAGTPGDARRVAVSGARAYVVDRNLGVLQGIDIARPTHPVLVNSIVDDPVMEGYCNERHNEAACVSANRGRVAVAGTVVHTLTSDCLCAAGVGDCNDYTGYLHVGTASAYESSPPRSGSATSLAGSPGDDAARITGATSSSTFALRGNEPNPFNPETSIRFDVPRSSRVRIQIYDARGRLVQTLVDDTLSPGPHEVSWRGRRDGGEAVASGIYFVTMDAENVRKTMKITLLR